MLSTSKDILNLLRSKDRKALLREREKMVFRFNNTKGLGHHWHAYQFYWKGPFLKANDGFGQKGRIVERGGKTYWLNPLAANKQGILILSENEINIKLRAAAAGRRKGGEANTKAKQAASRENGKKGGRPTIDEFNAKFPIIQDLQSGLWGWRKKNGSIDLKKCTFKSRPAASLDRKQSKEKASFKKNCDQIVTIITKKSA